PNTLSKLEIRQLAVQYGAWNSKKGDTGFNVWEKKVTATRVETSTNAGQKTVFKILAAISVCHLLNDMLSSLLPSIYPLLKSSFHLDFVEVGLMTLTYKSTASLLQPFGAFDTDRRPRPYPLPVGMGATLIGLILLA